MTAKWSYDAAAHEVLVAVTQCSRFGTFELPLTIQVEDSSGATRRGSVMMPPRIETVQQVRIPLGSRPVRVILDPEVELLASMTVMQQ